MQLYLLRHGQAGNPQPGGPDSERPLTDAGRNEIRSVLEALKRAGAHPEHVISSPYLRARQSAEIAAELFGRKDGFSQTEKLVPSSDPESLWEEVQTHKLMGSLLLVTHEPLMSRSTAFLLAAPAVFDVKTGCLICIEIDAGSRTPRGVLKWMLSPVLTA